MANSSTVNAVLDAARAECRIRGLLITPYRLGYYVGQSGYVERDMPSPYATAKAIKEYNYGLSEGFKNGGMRLRVERIKAGNA